MESCTKTRQKKPLVNGLAKVTNHPLPESASPDVLVGIGGSEDRRNCIPRDREVLVEFKSGHRGYFQVGDQAGGINKTSGC
jgi:hypothetical protein